MEDEIPVRRKENIFSTSDLINVYECIENMAGDKFENMKTRPWVQYHGSTGEKTIKWIHHRIKNGEGDLEIKLFIFTYKLIMGVDIKKLDLAIFIRYCFSVQLLN